MKLKVPLQKNDILVHTFICLNHVFFIPNPAIINQTCFAVLIREISQNICFLKEISIDLVGFRDEMVLKNIHIAIIMTKMIKVIC